jgi:hypothetical protein
MNIVLLSPTGPLGRHRQGTYKNHLRHAPLTLIRSASLVPLELNPNTRIFDEGLEGPALDVRAGFNAERRDPPTALQAARIPGHARVCRAPVPPDNCADAGRRMAR